VQWRVQSLVLDVDKRRCKGVEGLEGLNVPICRRVVDREGAVWVWASCICTVFDEELHNVGSTVECSEVEGGFLIPVEGN